jgi:hypothetical protein
VGALPEPEELHFYSQTDGEPITRAVAYRDGFEAWTMRLGSSERIFTGKPVVATYAAARDLPMIKQTFKARGVERLITAIDGESLMAVLVPLRIAAPPLAASTSRGHLPCSCRLPPYDCQFAGVVSFQTHVWIRPLRPS